MLTCILGRAGTRKTALLYERLGQAHAQGTPCIMIVPEQYTLQAERDIIEQLGIKGLLDIEVLSFSRLAYRVFSLSGGPKHTVVDSLGRAMLVRRALSELGNTNPFCARSADRPGFSAELTNTLSELKAYGITPGILKQALKTGNAAPNERLCGLLAVYEKVEEAMRGQFSDGEDLLDLLAQKLPQTALFREARVFIDGFESMTGKWMDVLGQLLCTCRGVDIAFCMPEGNEEDAWVFESEMQSFHAVSALAYALDCKMEVIRLHDTQKDRPVALAHLERNLFAPGTHTFTGDMHGLEFMRAAGKEQEANAVAARMVRLYRETGCNWRDMAVIVPDLPSDARVFRRVFGQYRIPCFFDEKRSLTGHPLVRCVLHALLAAENNYPQKEMTALIKTGLAGLTLSEAHVLENYMLAHGVKGKTFKQPFEKGEDEECAAAEALRERLMAPLLTLETALKKDRSVKTQARAVLDYLDQTGTQAALDAMHERLEQIGEQALLAASEQAMDTLRSVLEQAVALLGDIALKRGEFVRLLQSALQQEDTGIIPTSADAVLVGTWERTRLPSLRALFVTGCADGGFPPPPAENPLLGDPERDLLLKSGLKTGPDARVLWTVAQLRVYKALSVPDTLLHISASAEDRRGNALQDAHLFRKILSMYPGAKVRGSSVDGVNKEVTNAQAAFSELAAQMGQGQPPDKEWRAAYYILSGVPAWKERLEKLQSAAGRALPPPRVHMPPGKTLVPRQISVSRLETYSACPFSYFVRYALMPKKREVFEWTPLDAGAFTHAAMELFEKRLMHCGQNVREIPDEKIDEMIDSVLQEMQEGYQNGRLQTDAKMRYWGGRLSKTVRFCAWLLIEQLRASDFTLQCVELELPAGTYIEAAGMRVPLKGRIDRVDALTRGDTTVLRLVDYKSSYSKKLDYHEIYHGLSLQLPVYAHALQSGKTKSGRNIEIGGMVLSTLEYPVLNTQARGDEAQKALKKELRMKGKLDANVDVLASMDHTLLPGESAAFIPAKRNRDGALSKSSDALDAGGMRRLIRHAVDVAARIIGELHAGVIGPRPVQQGNEKQCSRCEYRAVCRFDEAFPGAGVRRIQTMKRDEFFRRLEQEGTQG
ncbi:MAG: PD-(D/E)XK nuclease family protein [Bacillota bacterium]